jgi:osmotically-inducible protein OsmY
MRPVKALLALAALVAALAGCFPPALTEAEMTDPGIKSRLEQHLRAHRELDLSKLSIDVHSKIVTITGVVPTWQDKKTIEKTVAETAGIDQSIINIIVPE